MSDRFLNLNSRPVAVIIGATSKWRVGGASSLLVHGERALNTEALPMETLLGLGGALALKFAQAGYHVVITTRELANAEPVLEGLRQQGLQGSAIELDLSHSDEIERVFARIKSEVGDPDVLIYNAGYMAGRDLPQSQELMEFFPRELFETAIDVACRGPFLVAQQVLPAMRKAGRGTIVFTNNQYALRGRKRNTGESLYYPRVMIRALAQALTEEYSSYGVHVANVIVDGFIGSPGTHELPQFQDASEKLIAPASIADAFLYLHNQDPTCWTHELQLTASTVPVNH